MINQEQIAAYREMAKNASENSMEAQIRANLESTCDKFAGNEDKFERCLSYLEECASEILEGKNGDVPDELVGGKGERIETPGTGRGGSRIRRPFSPRI